MEQHNAGGMMRKGIFGLTLRSLPFALGSVGALPFALSFPAQAQQPEKIYRKRRRIRRE